MPKLILNDIVNVTTSANDLNNNFTSIENAFLDVLSRNTPTSPNNMETDLDMNDHTIYNCKSLHTTDLRIGNESLTGLVDTAIAAAAQAQAVVVQASVSASESATSSVLAAASAASASISKDMAEAAALSIAVSINVKDPKYGAKGDGTTDDTVAIQAAIDYAASVLGGRVWFPEGQYLFTSLSITDNYINLYGTGRYSSVLICTSATGGITFSGSSLALGGVSDLGFLQSVDNTDTSSALLKATGVLHFTVKDCYFNGYFGVDNYANTLLSLNGTDIHIHNCSGVGGKTYGVFVTGGNDYFIDNCSFNTIATTGKPLYINSVLEGAVWVTSSAFIQGLECKFYNSKYIQIIGTYFDAAQEPVAVDTCEHVYFNGCEFANRPGAGVAFTSSQVWEVVNSMVINCGTDGIVVNAGCSDFIIANNIVDGNNTTNTAGVVAGINVGADITGFQILNNRIGNISASFGGHQKYGIAINTGASDYYTITGNTVTDNETAGIVDNGTGTHTNVSNNMGFNPRGPSAFYAGASPYTYTAGHSPEVVYINAGTVSSIVVNGVNIFQNTDHTVFLQPNSSVVVYHTVAPLMLASPM